MICRFQRPSPSIEAAVDEMDWNKAGVDCRRSALVDSGYYNRDCLLRWYGLVVWQTNGVERQECGQKKGPILCILAGVAGADALVEEGGWSRNTMAGLACGGMI